MRTRRHRGPGPPPTLLQRHPPVACRSATILDPLLIPGGQGFRHCRPVGGQTPRPARTPRPGR
jgi:hypothetical protein